MPHKNDWPTNGIINNGMSSQMQNQYDFQKLLTRTYEVTTYEVVVIVVTSLQLFQFYEVDVASSALTGKSSELVIRAQFSASM